MISSSSSSSPSRNGITCEGLGKFMMTIGHLGTIVAIAITLAITIPKLQNIKCENCWNSRTSSYDSGCEECSVSKWEGTNCNQPVCVATMVPSQWIDGFILLLLLFNFTLFLVYLYNSWINARTDLRICNLLIGSTSLIMISLITDLILVSIAKDNILIICTTIAVVCFILVSGFAPVVLIPSSKSEEIRPLIV